MAKVQNRALTKDQKQRRNTVWLLWLVYAFACAVRFLLAIANARHPVIVSDELVYLNIAKSLCLEGRVAFAGFPLQFDNLLYPLVLSPIYALPAGTDYYRYVQLVNVLLMNAAIFPAFYAARRVTGGNRGAWVTVAFVLLLPDCALSALALTESLGYPLIFAALLVTCIALDGKPRAWPPFVLAGLGFLMFLCKFSLALYAAGLFVGLALDAVLRCDRRALLLRCAGAALLLALIVAEKLLFAPLLVPENAELVNYYTDALGETGVQNIANGLKGSAVTLYAFLCAACFLPAVVPVAGLGRYEPRERSLAIGLLVGFVLMLGGACYLTFKDLSEGIAISGRVELRYTAFFLPMLVMLCMSSKLEGMKLNAVSAALLGFGAVASFVFSPFAIADTGVMDNVTLAFVSMAGSDGPRWFFMVAGAVLAVLGGLALWRWGFARWLRTTFLILLAVMFVLEGLRFNAQLPDISGDAEITADAGELSQRLDGDEALLVSAVPTWRKLATTIDTMDRGYLQHTSLYKLSANLAPDGTYVPFRLGRYINGMTVDRDTPGQLLVFDKESYPWTEFAEGVTCTAMRNGSYYLVESEADKPLVRSLLRTQSSADLDRFDLVLYDSDIIASGSVHIRLSMTAALGSDGAASVITAATESDTVQVNAPNQLGDVDLTLSLPSSTVPVVISLQCANCDGPSFMYIGDYQTE